MKKKKLKTKNNKKKIKKESKNYEAIIGSIFGFILTIILGNLSAKRPDDSLSFNPYNTLKLFSEGIALITYLPRSVAFVIGFIFLLIPATFFYVITKSLFKRKK